MVFFMVCSERVIKELADTMFRSAASAWYRQAVMLPVAVTKFQVGDSDEPEQWGARVLRQCQVGDVIEQLLAGGG